MKSAAIKSSPETGGPTSPNAEPPARLCFAYADIGGGSRNLALGCNLAGAVEAEIIYCVGRDHVAEVVAAQRGRFVLFTNFSVAIRRPARRGLAGRLAKILSPEAAEAGRGLLADYPEHAAAFDFLRELLRRHPELQVHVLTRATPQAVPDEIVKQLDPDGRATLTRTQELGEPVDRNKFIRLVLDRLESSLGHRNFERRGWDASLPIQLAQLPPSRSAVPPAADLPQGLSAGEAAARLGYSGPWLSTAIAQAVAGNTDQAGGHFFSRQPVLDLVRELAGHLESENIPPDHWSDREFSLLLADSFVEWRLGHGLLACARSFPNCRFYHAPDHAHALKLAEGRKIDVLVTNYRPGLEKFLGEFHACQPQAERIVFSSVIPEELVRATGAHFVHKPLFYGGTSDHYGSNLARVIHALTATEPPARPTPEDVMRRREWTFQYTLPRQRPPWSDAGEEEKRLLAQLDSSSEPIRENLWDLARFYCLTRRPHQSYGHWLRLLQLETDLEQRAKILLAAGDAMSLGKNLPEAITRYRQGLRLEPGSHETWYWLLCRLANCLNQTGEHVEAGRHARQAAELWPHHHFARLQSGQACEGQRRWLDAAENYIQAIRCEGGDLQAMRQLARIRHVPEVAERFGFEIGICHRTVCQVKWEQNLLAHHCLARAAALSPDPEVLTRVKEALLALAAKAEPASQAVVATFSANAGPTLAAWGPTLIVLDARANPDSAGKQLLRLQTALIVPVLVLVEPGGLAAQRPPLLDAGAAEVLAWPCAHNSLAGVLQAVISRHRPME